MTERNALDRAEFCAAYAIGQNALTACYRRHAYGGQRSVFARWSLPRTCGKWQAGFRRLHR